MVEKLTGLLVDAGVLGMVELKLIDKNKKIAAAAYQYKAVYRYANDDVNGEKSVLTFLPELLRS